MKTTWAFAIKSQADTIDLDIYDTVGGLWSDAPTPKQVLDRLTASKDAKEIHVRINSIGGEVFAGIALYSILADHPAKVRVTVDGLAASIASVVCMAGDTIEMSESAMMFLHLPWSVAVGNSDEMRKTAALLDKTRDQLVAIYAARSGQDPQDVRDTLEAETWMTAAEALELGYCTKVIPSKTIAAHAGAVLDLSDFPNAPARARALAEAIRSPVAPPAPTPALTPPPTTKVTTTMARKYEDLTNMERHALRESDPAALAASRRDWISRGQPKALSKSVQEALAGAPASYETYSAYEMSQIRDENPSIYENLRAEWDRNGRPKIAV